MESALLDDLSKAVLDTGLPKPNDARGKLTTNPRAAKWKRRNVDGLKGMVWHQALGWGSVESVAEYHTGKHSHLAKGGVESIAYTVAIRSTGQLVLCNDVDRAVWSQGFKDRAGDENAEFLSVMFEGMFKGPGVTDPSAGHPTDAQLTAGLLVWRRCAKRWGWNGEALYGHYHFGKPACPGYSLQSVIESIRSNVARPAHDFTSVRGRQQALADLGFYDGKVDGLWGPRSKGSLIRFQESCGLEPDGVWSDETSAIVLAAVAG